MLTLTLSKILRMRSRDVASVSQCNICVRMDTRLHVVDASFIGTVCMQELNIRGMTRHVAPAYVELLGLQEARQARRRIPALNLP